MIHNLLITIDGHTSPAICTVGRNRDYVREVTSVAAPWISTRIMAALDESAISIHDILEVVRNYLNDTATLECSADCGPIHFKWEVQDRDALRADLTGRSYHVKLTGKGGLRFECNVGADSSWQAMDAAKTVTRFDVWSSVVTPMDPQ